MEVDREVDRFKIVIPVLAVSRDLEGEVNFGE
jgi:hypothetical protein